MWNMAQSLWYRKSVFEEAGIEPHHLDEWLAAAEALTKDGQYGIGIPANKNLYTDQTVYDFMINGGADEIHNSTHATLQQPGDCRGVPNVQRSLQISPPDSPGWAWGEAEACFANRTCAMIPAVRGHYHLRHAS